MNLIIFFILFKIITSKITFQNGLQATQITIKDVHSFSQVLVQAQFNYIDDKTYQKLHLVIKATNKHKKQAYLDLMKKYNGLVSILMKIKAIPNKQSMIHSIIHRNYLRKSRKWQLFRYFIVYTRKDDVERIKQYLRYYKTEVVRNSPAVQYLDQKFMSIAAFIQAKLQLQKFIKEHLNSQYQILKTKDIEIIGEKVQNQQIIQDHIEQQFNKGTKKMREQKDKLSDTVQEKGFYSNSQYYKPVKRLAIKVLFQLVNKSIHQQDIFQQNQQNQQQSESISDFQQQIKQQNQKQDQSQTEQQENWDKQQL